MEPSREQIKKIVRSYPCDQRHALAIMQDMQRTYKYVPREGLEFTAEYLGCHVSSLYSMATFYKALSLTPKGEHIIKLCNGTACHIRGSMPLIENITKELRLDADGNSTDGQFSLELVNCLGSCALAPVMVIDDVYYGKMTVDKMLGLIAEVKKGGAD